MLVILCTHVYWILPSLQSLSKSFLADPVYTGSGMVSFLSFADFSHALSLLHPNWPENLFGKVYFLQPEFLVVPILAFSSLLFVDISKHRKDSGGSIKYQVSSIEYETKYVIPKTTYFVQFFALLALVGVLLAKGAREPFGGIYVWLFDHVLGFVMFRDPTKFYVLSAISYALLIPFTLQQIASAISIRYQVSLLRPQKRNFGGQASIKYKKIIPNTLYVILTTLFIVYWCFTIRPLFLGDLSGNFKPQTIPFEYEKLKDMLVADTNPSRTLWIPQQDIFAYLSKQHPLLSGTTLFQNASQSGLVNRIRTPAFLRDISVSGVRYIIVPIDIEKRIFLSDYRYDPGIREQLIQVLAESGLRRLPEFTDTAVFENPAFTFTRDVSLSVAKQESLSRIGVLLSLTSWLFCLTILICTKRKYGR